MSDKINVVKILQKHGIRFAILYQNKPEFREAIKEVVEAVVDKCAEEAETYNHPYLDACHQCGHTATYVDKQSILNIKQEIEYE